MVQYGGENEQEFSGGSITSDGGYIVGGFDRSYNTNTGGYFYKNIVVKYDKNGKQEWVYNTSISETTNNDSICGLDSGTVSGYKDVIELKNGTFLAVGDYHELKYGEDPDIGNTGYFDTTVAIATNLDKTGKYLWEDRYQGELNASFTDVVQLKNGKIKVVGKAGHNRVVNVPTRDCVATARYYDALLFEYSEDLVYVDENIYDGSDSETLDDVEETEDDVYVAVGEYSSDDIDEIDLVDNSDGLIITNDKEENEEEIIKPVDKPKDEDIENPKTGVEDYIFALVIVFAVCVIIYNIVDSYKIFKKL